MTDEVPAFPPFMLTGLTYAEAKTQARATGCALRRPHWCTPVLVYEEGRLWLDDEGIVSVWVTAPEDMRASDWMMVPREVNHPAPPPPQSERRDL